MGATPSSTQEDLMPLYMSRFGYSAETWASLVRSPENRQEAVAAILDQHGCKLHNLWYSFGDEDGFALIEAPNNVSAASVAIAITSSGAFTKFTTSVLMTQDEALEAMRQASEVHYAAPGQAVHA
jgi:uncharacterized protein with GYD domain